MKKNLFLSLFLSIILSSCIDKENFNNVAEDTYDFNRFRQTDVLKVTVPEGQIGIVKSGDDTLYVLTKSEEVMIPYIGKSVTTRAATDNSIVVSYADASVMDKIKYGIWGDMAQTIAFEDSRNGDYDYNDVVLHIRIGKGGAQSGSGISVQPVALGSTKVLGLGAYVTETNTNKIYKIVFSNNIRNDFFEGKQGFINTDSEIGVSMNKWYKFDFTSNGFTNVIKVNWFLIDGSEEMFAVSDDFYSKSLDAKGRPYGLVFTDIHEKYLQVYNNGKKTIKKGEYMSEAFWFPREHTNIIEAYPLFSELFDASSNVDFATVFANPVKDKVVAVMQLFNVPEFGDNCYDISDTGNLYYVRENDGYVYYNNGGELKPIQSAY